MELHLLVSLTLSPHCPLGFSASDRPAESLLRSLDFTEMAVTIRPVFLASDLPESR